ncbi:hypothetical protein CEXT_483411 [Caerostris extrusa]|uniref:Uncharacterized protein n=1 Tax=Caerostris extrusa TaxID=172846 RepID=A0AAV4NS91_CAEEX|nr:hypothetical protein CEXT_483411 [Caerostris extrusa]
MNNRWKPFINKWQITFAAGFIDELQVGGRNHNFQQQDQLNRVSSICEPWLRVRSSMAADTVKYPNQPTSRSGRNPRSTFLPADGATALAA